MVGGKENRGKPRRWRSAGALLGDWQEYCDYIVENDFCCVPTWTDFARWLDKRGGGVDRKTIFNALYKYFPEIKKEMSEMRADILVQGAALGKYRSTPMCIFALKNWCGWVDRQEMKSDNCTKVEVILPEDVDQYAD